MLPILEPMIASFIDRLFEEYCSEEVIVENWDLKGLEKELVHVLADRDVTFPTIMTSKEELREFVEPILQDYLAAIREHREDENYQLSFKRMLIIYLDNHWLEHIDAMERLKEGMSLRNYGGEDPMRQYEREGLELFTIMYERIEADISKETSRIEITL
jgi:preprotein translocase subunit SecA